MFCRDHNDVSCAAANLLGRTKTHTSRSECARARAVNPCICVHNFWPLCPVPTSTQLAPPKCIQTQFDKRISLVNNNWLVFACQVRRLVGNPRSSKSTGACRHQASAVFGDKVRSSYRCHLLQAHLCRAKRAFCRPNKVHIMQWRWWSSDGKTTRCVQCIVFTCLPTAVATTNDETPARAHAQARSPSGDEMSPR